MIKKAPGAAGALVISIQGELNTVALSQTKV